jgi:hypothetical protein
MKGAFANAARSAVLYQHLRHEVLQRPVHHRTPRCRAFSNPQDDSASADDLSFPNLLRAVKQVRQ